MASTQESLQYPIGRFHRPEAITPEQVAAAVEDIAALPSQLRAAVDGLNGSQLDTPYRDGGWTVRQVVHHIADSHLNANVRLRIAITEQDAAVRPYDENAWAQLPDAQSGPIDISLALVDALHARWAALARTLTAEQLQTTFHHPEYSAPQSVDATLAMYAWHGKHHVAHITSLRRRMSI